ETVEAVTLKQVEQEPTPASGLVTVTVRLPTVAAGSTVTLAVSWVALVNAVELTVTPVPKVAAAPETKPVPVIVMFWLAAPWARDVGLVAVTLGAALTLKQLAHEPVLASGSVTVTARVPTVAAGSTVMLAVSWVALTNVVELTVIPAPNVADRP